MKTPATPARLHLWVPELCGAGGIQHYSRMLLRGLTELLPATDIRVLSKNDPIVGPQSRKSVSYRLTGGSPRSIRTFHFSALLAQQTLLHRPNLAILTHLHFAPAAYALKRLIGLRYWVVAHGVEAWRRPSSWMREALAGAERILPVSEHTQNAMMSDSLRDRSLFSVLSNAVDEHVFFPGPKPDYLLRRYGLHRKQKIVFTLSRLDSREGYKGHDAMLDALSRAKKTLPEVHYLLAGGGDDSTRILERVRQLGLEKHVTLTGFLPDSDLRDHYCLCDLFAMPSQDEGFGIVYLEALACGRPVLAGNGDGSREPLLNGELGTRVNPHDPTALVHALIGSLLGRHEPSLRDPLFLRRRVVEEFGFEVFKQKLGLLLET